MDLRLWSIHLDVCQDLCSIFVGPFFRLHFGEGFFRPKFLARMLPKIFCPECWPEIRPGVGFFVDPPPMIFFRLPGPRKYFPGNVHGQKYFHSPAVSLDFLCFFVDIPLRFFPNFLFFFVDLPQDFLPRMLAWNSARCWLFRRPPLWFFKISVFFRRPPPGFFLIFWCFFVDRPQDFLRFLCFFVGVLP